MYKFKKFIWNFQTCNLYLLYQIKNKYMQLHTKEFYEAMSMFEATAKKTLRTGSQGFTKEPKEHWPAGYYYCDDTANQGFRMFLNGLSYGKSLYDEA